MNKYRVTVLMIILIISAGILGGFFFIDHFISDVITETIAFEINTENMTEEIQCCISGDEVYVFLPSFVNLSDVSLSKKKNRIVYIDNDKISDEMKCTNYKLSTPYKLVIENKGEYTLTFFKSENIASMWVNTLRGNEESLYKNKHKELPSSVKLFTKDGDIDYSSDDCNIHGRGNMTWKKPKKPFVLKLKQNGNLLNMGEAKKWILLANDYDRTKIRNKLIYDFSKKIGLEAPDSEFVDLYLNGEYIGLYQLTEKIEVAENRLDISEDSYLFRREANERKALFNYSFTTNLGEFIGIENPVKCTYAQKTEITELIQNMEDSFSDTDKWKDYIDCESWTKKYLVEEIFGNMDAGWASQYFYYTPGNADSKIYAGPVWDYDFSIGNSQAELSIQNPKCFIANRLKIMEIMGSVHTYWYHLLYNNKEFYSSMVEIYKSEVLPALNDIDKDIINLEQEIAPSLIMDQKRWGEDDTDTASETESLKRFLTEHISFLNSAWLDNVNYHTIIVDRDEGKRHLYYCIKAGEKFENQPTQDKIELSDTEALFNKETGEKFDFDQPINEDLELYIKSCDEISSSDKKGLYTNIVHLIKICVKISPIGVIGILLVVLIVIDLKENSRG